MWAFRAPPYEKEHRQIGKLLAESLAGIPDFRRTGRGNFRYPVKDILILLVISQICGLSKFEEIEDYGRANRAWLHRNFGTSPNHSPSDSTLHRFMSRLCSDSMASAAQRFATGLIESEVRSIAVDGKSMNSTVCGETGRHLHNLTAFDSAGRIPIATKRCDEKSNEITKWEELLDSCREFLKGTLFTGDAMGCQTRIVERIRDGDAHYLLGVKDNQKTLAEGIELTRRLKRPCDESTSVDAGHGRVVTRTCKIYNDLSLIERLPNWRDLRTLVVIESKTRTVKTNRWTDEVRFYISDLPGNAEFFNREVRRHWMIENYLHWNLDYAFRQDKCVRKDTTASGNLDTIQKIAFTILSVNKIWVKKGVDAGMTKKMRMAGLKKSVLRRFLNL